MTSDHAATGLKPVLTFRDLVVFYVVAVFGLRLIPFAASIGPGIVAFWVIAFLGYCVPLALTVAMLGRPLLHEKAPLGTGWPCASTPDAVSCVVCPGAEIEALVGVICTLSTAGSSAGSSLRPAGTTVSAMTSR